LNLPVLTPAVQFLASLYPEEYRKLVASLTAARKEAGMTQADLARALGRPQSFVSKFESSERRLDPIEFIRIAQLLEADPFDVLSAAVAARRERPVRKATRQK
jgi:transcriptional regulator with XRE-family HTH domain